MAIRLLRWQGPARTQACRGQLAARLAEWSSHWCASGGTPALTAVAPPDADDLCWHGARHAGAGAWLGHWGSGKAALGASLVGEAQADELGLGAGLATRALDDLLARILSATPDRLEALPAPDTTELAVCHGAIGFDLSGVLAGWALFIDAGACDLLAPIAAGAREPLSDRARAVAPERITLDVVLPLGELALAESLSFRVGEVLLAGSLADAEVRIQTASGQAVAGGVLARQGEGRAIRIDTNHIKQGPSK